jgi:hypothetical protein
VKENTVKKMTALLMAGAMLFVSTACTYEKPSGEVTPGSEPVAAAAADAGSPLAAGKVIETMNTGGYTYVQVDTGSEKVWAAAPECVVEVGDQVVVPQGMAMPNYHSKTLDRDFELVYFVSSLNTPEGEPLTKGSGIPAGHPPLAGHGSMTGKSTPAEVDVSGVEKAEGGKTVAEIYAEKTELAGKEVVLRGKVVKYNGHIMGKNWLHVRDGSGDAAAGTNDLTVTTDVAVQVGDTVLVTGEVHLDKDFGSGYRYDVIIEDARVLVE